MLHGDNGYRFRVGDILVHMADHHDVVTIMQRFIDADTVVAYYWIRDDRGFREIVTSHEVNCNYVIAK